MEKAKLVVEGAGAVGVAALLGGQIKPGQDGTTVAVLSGGNVDAGLLHEVARRHETEAGRRLVLLTRVPDRPGSLAQPAHARGGDAARTSSRSSTSARASTCTSARPRSSSCSRPAAATTRASVHARDRATAGYEARVLE